MVEALVVKSEENCNFNLLVSVGKKKFYLKNIYNFDEGHFLRIYNHRIGLEISIYFLCFNIKKVNRVIDTIT